MTAGGWIEVTRLPEHGYKDRAAEIGDLGRIKWHKRTGKGTDRIEQLGQDNQDRTAETSQPRWDSWDRTAWV
jgi:hypothetical protein